MTNVEGSVTTEQPRGFGLNLGTLGFGHVIAIVLAAITGLVHLYLFIDQGFLPFLAAGVGFFGWIVVLALTKGSYRHLLYLAGIGLAFGQLVGYYVVEQPASLADMTSLALGTKLVEVVLIVVLAYLFYSEWDGL